MAQVKKGPSSKDSSSSALSQAPPLFQSDGFKVAFSPAQMFFSYCRRVAPPSAYTIFKTLSICMARALQSLKYFSRYKQQSLKCI